MLHFLPLNTLQRRKIQRQMPFKVENQVQWHTFASVKDKRYGNNSGNKTGLYNRNRNERVHPAIKVSYRTQNKERKNILRNTVCREGKENVLPRKTAPRTVAPADVRFLA